MTCYDKAAWKECEKQAWASICEEELALPLESDAPVLMMIEHLQRANIAVSNLYYRTKDLMGLRDDHIFPHLSDTLYSRAYIEAHLADFDWSRVDEAETWPYEIAQKWPDVARRAAS